MLLPPTTKVSNVYLGFKFGLSGLAAGKVLVCFFSFTCGSATVNESISLGKINLTSYALPITSSIETFKGIEYFFETNSVPSCASLTKMITTLLLICLVIAWLLKD